MNTSLITAQQHKMNTVQVPNQGASDDRICHHTMLIFVVDDHEMMRDAMVGVLRRTEKTAKAREFKCFEEFLDAVDIHGAPDLLVLNLTLPRILGYEGVRHARALCPKMRLAVYSASPALDREQQCIASGADIYIEKTNSSGAFYNAIKKLLN